MTFNLDGYTTVAERIGLFYTQYPAGVITTQPAKTIDLAGTTFISVIARVYLDRHMEDAPVTEAEAWEPFPGKTPYTRDSEMMNAATSAIGRALMQLNIGITEAGAASADEVRVAQERRQPSGDARQSGVKGTISDSQRGYLLKLAKTKGFSGLEDTVSAAALAGVIENSDAAQLSSRDASSIIDWLKQLLALSKPASTEEYDPWGGFPQ